MEVLVPEGFYSWVLPTGDIRVFHVGSPQTIVLSFDAGDGVYQLIGPEGTSTYTHSAEVEAPQTATPSVYPTICGPGDVILFENLPVGAIVSYWGNLSVVPDTGELRALSPANPGTFPISINGAAFSSVVVVQAIKHNAKIDCAGVAEEVTYAVDITPNAIKHNGSAIITVCIRNPNNITADAAVPRIALPAWLTTSPPIEIPSFTLAPHSQVCRSFVATANVTGTDTVDFTVAVATADATLTVSGVPEVPEVVFEYLKSSNHRVRVGASYYVEGLVRNKTKTPVTVTLAQLVTNLVRIEGERAISVEVPAYGHYTFRYYCIAEAAGAASLTIPTGALTATSGGVTSVISGVKVVNITQIP